MSLNVFFYTDFKNVFYSRVVFVLITLLSVEMKCNIIEIHDHRSYTVVEVQICC